MRKRICPVCDREMQSSNYCKTCHRFVRKPYIKDIDYYLNESHPRVEEDCSYHDVQADQTRPIMQAGQTRPIGQAGQTRPIGQAGQTQVPAQTPAQPQAGWQRQPSSGRAAPAYQASQLRPTRTIAPIAQTVKKKESNKWILFLAAFFVVIFFGATQFFRFVTNQISNIGFDSNYDVDLGTYEQDMELTEWDEEHWKELADDEVRAAGERCTGNAHFSVTLAELESEVVHIIENHGYQVLGRDSYSYNTQYDVSAGSEYTSYCTWTYYEIVPEQPKPEEYIYQDVYFDHDTVTDELHSIEITMAGMEPVIAISGEVLDLMVTKGLISSAADYGQILTAISQQSFNEEEYYTTADGSVEIWSYGYDDSYCIYIRPSVEYDW